MGIFLFAYKKRVDYLKREKIIQENFSINLIESREKERKRIAGELHDSLGQNLLIVSNEIKQYLIQPDNEMEDLKHASQTIHESINEVREIAYNLHPHQLDRLGLTKAIKSVVSKISRSSDINFTLDMDEIDSIFPKEQEIHFYRIIQEALNNIMKHSHAKDVQIKIRTGDVLEVVIKDNGKGFEQSVKSGFGLTEMKERVKMINGTLEIVSQIDVGTEVKIEIKADAHGAKHGTMRA
ncbi:MAG: sensor histidine kinase, partial [Calditrichia bacterium]|nr:sensor histidine kinase [Calditrichia bacterium]